MYKFNNGDGALICDKCRIIIKEGLLFIPKDPKKEYCFHCNKNKPVRMIVGLDEMQYILNKQTDYNVVSIRSTNTAPEYYAMVFKNRDNYKEIIAETFDDIDEPGGNWKLMEMQQLVNIIEWSKGKEKIITHCTAGYSRSAAIAYLIEYEKSKNASVAIRILNPMLNNPNRHIVNLGVELFGDKDIYDELKEWRIQWHRERY